MSNNPFCTPAPDGIPVLELKQGVVLYLEDPPGPVSARRVYDHYLARCGDRVRVYRSTSQAASLVRWDAAGRHRFETTELPAIRARNDWGYAFSDARNVDSWLFMFHGYRPHTEAGKASFYRFDFPWDVDLAFLRDFTAELVTLVPCISGFAGYYLQGRPAPDFTNPSYDSMFAVARRYWGLEAHNLDVTVDHVLEGYKCVNWLTIIGEKLRKQDPEAVEAAKAAAFAHVDTGTTVLLQAERAPRFGDRNRREVLDGYVAVAKALLPLQIQEHAPFGGTRWDEDNTIRYIRRFTHPRDVK